MKTRRTTLLPPAHFEMQSPCAAIQRPTAHARARWRSEEERTWRQGRRRRARTPRSEWLSPGRRTCKRAGADDAEQDCENDSHTWHDAPIGRQEAHQHAEDARHDHRDGDHLLARDDVGRKEWQHDEEPEEADERAERDERAAHTPAHPMRRALRLHEGTLDGEDGDCLRRHVCGRREHGAFASGAHQPPLRRVRLGCRVFPRSLSHQARYDAAVARMWMSVCRRVTRHPVYYRFTPV
eukprot:5425954-Prymnesium_polylepis.1